MAIIYSTDAYSRIRINSHRRLYRSKNMVHNSNNNNNNYNDNIEGNTTNTILILIYQYNYRYYYSGIPKESTNNDYLEIITNTVDDDNNYDDDEDANPKGFNIPPFDKPIGGGFDENKKSNDASNLLPLTNSDMQKLGVLLADISGCFETSIIKTPEEEAQLAKEGTKKALKIVTAEMKWLYRRNVPGLVQMLLQSPQGPILRQNTSIMNAYLFIIDFLEAVANESSSSIKVNQSSLRALLEAAKKGEDNVDEVIRKDVQTYTDPAFFVYLDSEIDNSSEAMNQLLTTVKLRLLDEVGKEKGIDIQMIASLATINDPLELKKKTMSYLYEYDKDGVSLFLQVLKILNSEMKKRYNNVDAGLLLNMAEIERICISYIDSKK